MQMWQTSIFMRTWIYTVGTLDSWTTFSQFSCLISLSVTKFGTRLTSSKLHFLLRSTQQTFFTVYTTIWILMLPNNQHIAVLILLITSVSGDLVQAIQVGTALTTVMLKDPNFTTRKVALNKTKPLRTRHPNHQ
jgi:hypothetical protein